MVDIRDEFYENGFVLIKRALPYQDTLSIRYDVMGAFSPQFSKCGIKTDHCSDKEFAYRLFLLFDRNQKSYLQTAKICQNLVSVHQLGLSREILRLVYRSGIDTPSICTRPVMYFHSKNLALAEEHHKTAPHQDWRSMQGSLNSVVVWIPFVDVDPELGPLEVVRGSHKKGLLDTVEDNWYRKIKDTSGMKFEPIEVEEGDMVLFSSFLVHRSGENKTHDRIRWSCHFRYNDLSEPTFIKRNYPTPYIYKPQQDLITPNFPKTLDLETLPLFI